MEKFREWESYKEGHMMMMGGGVEREEYTPPSMRNESMQLNLHRIVFSFNIQLHEEK